MKTNRTIGRWSIVPLVVAAIVVILVSSGLTQAQGNVPAQVNCAWRAIGTSTSRVFHTASAMDTDANRLYIYGGVDSNFDTDSGLEVGDLSATSLSYKGSTVPVSGAASLVGAAAAYRAKGKDNDADAVYFFGGMNDPAKGQGTNDVQRYLTKSGKWESLTLANAGAFSGRSFAAAAYDPVHAQRSCTR